MNALVLGLTFGRIAVAIMLLAVALAVWSTPKLIREAKAAAAREDAYYDRQRTAGMGDPVTVRERELEDERRAADMHQ